MANFTEGTNEELRKSFRFDGVPHSIAEGYISHRCSEYEFHEAPFGVLDEEMLRIFNQIYCDNDHILNIVFDHEKNRLCDMSFSFSHNADLMSGYDVIKERLDGHYFFTNDWLGHIWFFYFNEKRTPDHRSIYPISKYIAMMKDYRDSLVKYEFKFVHDRIFSPC